MSSYDWHPTLLTKDGAEIPVSEDNPYSKTTIRECLAMRILRADGHRPADLAPLFDVHPKTVRRHVRGDCRCPTLPELDFLDRIDQGDQR